MKRRLMHALLTALAIWPLPVLYLLSDFIFLIVYYVVGYRRKVVRENLVSSFPQKSGPEILKIEKGYYRFLCDVIIETLKLFHISDKELARRVKVENAGPVNSATGSGKSAVLFLGHYGNWEWAQEITRHFEPYAKQISIYHPLNSKLWDSLFQEMRSRWHADIVPMNKALRTLIDKKNMPWICGFIADQWTWTRKNHNETMFLNHPTYFIYGPEEIGSKVKADFFYLEMNRVKRGYYRITFHKLEAPDAHTGSFPHTREFWKEFEETVIRNPQYWMWSHKRWKE